MSLTTYKDAEAQIYEFGLDPDHLIIDGRYHRCPYSSERRAKMSGFYKLREILREDEFLVDGVFGSFKVSEQHFQIERRVELGYSQDKISMLKEKAAALSIQKHEEEREEKELAAHRAESIWETLDEKGESPYLERKMVGAYGIRFFRGSITVPMCKEGRLCSLQSISANGSKKFLPRGDTSGVHHIIPGSQKVALCEGYATGASIHEATGWTVAICFSTNGIISAAPYFKKKDVVICADNDRETELNIGKNPGIVAAQKAAEYLQCNVIVPEITDLCQSDFNDIHVFEGLEEVRRQCLASMTS